MVRVTLTGPELAGFDPGLPAASVRLLLPSKSGSSLGMPTWNGNEFLLEDGSRPIIRTLTPLRFDPSGPDLDVEVVRHGPGPLSAWAGAAAPGDEVALSGTGRGYEVDPDTSRFLLAGDESALPAISVLLQALPPHARVEVHAELSRPDARLELPPHPGASVRWHDLDPGAPPGDELFAAVVSADWEPEARLWVAGEAAAVQRVRRHLFGERDVARSRAVVRGYWKRGRSGDDE
jgi:NADPH-dependent ferric siderophore reductase